MLNAGIAVDEDNRVLMADQFHRKVDVYRPATLTTEQGFLGVLPKPTDEEYKAKKAALEAKALKKKAETK